MVQAYDYFHTPGNDGITPLLPLILAPLGTIFQATLNTDRLAFQPFFVGDEPLPLAQLSVYVTCTGFVSGGRWRLGIYATKPPEDQDIYPQALVKDFGLTANPTSGGLQWLTTAAAAGVTLTNGLYYCAAVFEGVAAATYRSLNRYVPPNAVSSTGPWLINSQGTTGTPLGWWTARSPALALPATAPLGMNLSEASFSAEQWNPAVFPVF